MSIASVTIFVIIIIVAIIRDTWRQWVKSKLVSLDDTTETVEDIPINDWRDEMRRQRVLRLRSAGANLSQIEERIWPGAESRGGGHFNFIKSVLEECDPLGEYGPPTHPTETDAE